MKTVLVIDDEAPVRDFVSRFFGLSGYRVLEAENGREGVAKFREHGDEIDLVLLDMVMPQMGGRDTFYALKEVRSDAPVVIISGYSASDQTTELISEGALGFVPKPFEVDDLLGVVDRVLDREADAS